MLLQTRRVARRGNALSHVRTQSPLQNEDVDTESCRDELRDPLHGHQSEPHQRCQNAMTSESSVHHRAVGTKESHRGAQAST